MCLEKCRCPCICLNCCLGWIAINTLVGCVLWANEQALQWCMLTSRTIELHDNSTNAVNVTITDVADAAACRQIHTQSQTLTIVLIICAWVALMLAALWFLYGVECSRAPRHQLPLDITAIELEQRDSLPLEDTCPAVSAALLQQDPVPPGNENPNSPDFWEPVEFASTFNTPVAAGALSMPR